MANNQTYRMGNSSDVVKHGNLITLAENINFNTYVELHSNSGREGEYNGSPIKMMGLARDLERDVKFFFHERDGDIRKELLKNVGDQVKDYGADPNKTTVRGRWQEDIENYLEQADSNWLFLIDPTTAADYKNGISNHLGEMLDTGASIFMYFPQTVLNRPQTKSLKNIYTKIRRKNRNAVDFQFPVPNTYGNRERVDHNIVVAPKGALKKVSKKFPDLTKDFLVGTKKKVSITRVN